MRYVPDFIKGIYDRSPIWTKNMFSTGYGILKTKKEKNRYFRDCLEELRKTESWKRKQLDELQNRKLRKIIRHCAENVKYYKEIFASHGINPGQIQTREDLKKLPIISKEEIIKNTDDMIASGYSKSNLIAESSSGTTGKPITVYWDREDYAWSVAARHIVTERMGYREGRDWLAIMNGYQILPISRSVPPYWIKDFYNKTTHLSAFHLSESTIDDYHRYLEKKSIEYIMGYSSVVGLVASLMSEKNLTLDINSVLLSSEPYYQWQIDAINKAFPCKIINSYGQAERVAIGGSCGSGMNIHLFDNLSIIEFAETEKHENREMIATSLVNYAMPLIRYELGDISDFAEPRCVCGNEHTTILPVTTKSEDFVVTPDKKYISASLLTFPFKHPVGVAESQIIQLSRDEITVNLKVNRNYSRETENQIKRDLQEILGTGIRIHFSYPDFIPRTKSGKFRFVISKLKN